MAQLKYWTVSSAVSIWNLSKKWLRKLNYNFVLHLNESAHIKSRRLGMDPAIVTLGDHEDSIEVFSSKNKVLK